MSQPNILTGLCPQCGEQLEIPAHLKQFSCMFCGARLSPADLAENAPVGSEGAKEAAAYYEAHILEVITEHTGIERELTKNGYAPAIDAYEKDTREIFEALNTACLSGTLTVDSAAALFLDQLEQRWSGKRSPASVRDADKFVIAVFLIPMIRRMGLACGEEFCTAFHSLWMKRYPKSPFMIGDFDSINNGFKKKFLGLCFITTATCLQENKPDDCAELMAFRGFRDGYLRSCPDGAALIDEYYRTAPMIVLEIEKHEDAARRYEAIRRSWLEPCYADIRAGELSRCKERYTEMVRSLQKEYLS